jgi:cytochrome c biogenesis protein CcmG, thiol:disulfide interchange protein DsbE
MGLNFDFGCGAVGRGLGVSSTRSLFGVLSTALIIGSMRMWRRRAGAGLWMGLGCLLAAGCDRGSHPEQLGRVAPEFVVTDGVRQVDLAKLRGQVVVLNFWATNCAPCIAEMPSLEAMQRELPGVVVLAVSTDEDSTAYREFVVRHHISLLTVQDAAQASNALYGTFRFPETYVIDKQGMVRRKFIGAQEWTSPEIVAALKKLVAEG